MHGELRMTYLLLDYLIQFKTYWKVLLVLDGWLQMTTHNCTQICIPLLFSSRGTDGNGFLFL
ncbi:hypothetical protein PHAVU_002G205500 [Phaseolus vulgaris]|uniref:Uncharacterized protein n=1 Tax=Phaseolus vulgaris TaxID=3885 RepID=V7CP82_PHAVU|nr:hypothetical protein PHAVU_002G205500g [Phaseolus vulgaris]ESW31060.1 hypothetical protein PHAVU_002G205500g [Phaseolus vulgaris]